MVRIKTLVLALLCSIGAMAETPIHLKVMSMNLKESCSYAAYDVEPYCELIASYDPDFVSLQEIDLYAYRSQSKNYVAEMAERLGMFPIFGRAIDIFGGSYGIAILSKYPYMNATTIVDKASGANEQRAASWIDVILPTGRQVRLGATHLDVASAESVRISLMAKINTNMLAGIETPALMMGDFNTYPSTESYNYFSIKWQDMNPGAPATCPSDAPTNRIDFIFGYPQTWTLIDYETITRTDLSDHCFIMAEVEHP